MKPSLTTAFAVLINLVIAFTPGMTVDKGVNAFKPLQKKPIAIVQAKLQTLETIPISVQDYARLELKSRGRASDFTYVNYIFTNESGWRTNSINSIGCKGLGQSCGHASFTCGLDDATCQMKWFDNYAQSAYGGWYNAYIFWINNHWW